MKPKDLAYDMLEMEDELQNCIDGTYLGFARKFVSTAEDNELVHKEAEMHETMCSFIIASYMNSRWKKEFEAVKKRLDINVGELGKDPTGVAGQTVNLHESNIFKFTKRQNKDGEQMSVTDLLNALARAGVEKAVIDAATKMATKPKRGNVYYDVTTVEE